MKKFLNDIDNESVRERDASRFLSLRAHPFELPKVEVTRDKQWSKLSIEVSDQQKAELYNQPFSTLKQFDNGRLIYRSIESGLCEFFATCSVERGGFGGRTFNFEMDDGSTLKCGAWSSNSGAINEYLHDHQIMGIHTIVAPGLKTWGLSLDVGVAQYALIHWAWDHLEEGSRRPFIAEVPMFRDGTKNWCIVWYDEDLRCFCDRFENGKTLDSEDLTFAVGTNWD